MAEASQPDVFHPIHPIHSSIDDNNFFIEHMVQEELLQPRFIRFDEILRDREIHLLSELVMVNSDTTVQKSEKDEKKNRKNLKKFRKQEVKGKQFSRMYDMGKKTSYRR